MLIHKINATQSTNNYLKSLMTDSATKDWVVVVANEQLQGRGQMNTTWQSQKDKSLTFSVLKRFKGFSVEDQFYLSKAVSVAVFEALTFFQISDLKIKWPNDILSDQKKMAGILIENFIKNTSIYASIVGIGLNVNEDSFCDLPRATSMKLTANRHFDLEAVFLKLLQVLQEKMELLENKQFDCLDRMYLSNLHKLEVLTVFENAQHQLFEGIIRGVSKEGKLVVETKNEALRSFDLKEIKWVPDL